MQLTKEEYNFLLERIQCNFIPRKTTNQDICAYTIHGIFERIYDKGFYVDETTVAKALIECGYSPLYQDGQIYFTYLINLELFKYTMLLLAIPQRLVHFNGCSVSEF